MKKVLFLILLIVPILFSACKKTEINNYPESSQLWIKVSNSLPDCNIKFNYQDIKNRNYNYSALYKGKVFNPNLSTFTDTSINETWVLVYKSFARTDEIAIQLSENGNVYKARGFEYGENRFIEIIRNPNGTIGVEDRDVSTINKIILVE